MWEGKWTLKDGCGGNELWKQSELTRPARRATLSHALISGSYLQLSNVLESYMNSFNQFIEQPALNYLTGKNVKRFITSFGRVY